MPPRSRRRLALALALVALTTPTLAQEVWVVDAQSAPGTDFTSIQPAIDAAADGDVVLVRGRFNHLYDGFVATSRELVIVGEPDLTQPAPVLVPPRVGPSRVEAVPADGELVLRSLELLSPDTTLESALTVSDCVGAVVLEELSLMQEWPPVLALPVTPPLVITSSANVVLVRSYVVGARGLLALPPGSAAIMLNSYVFMHHASLFGGDGAPVGAQGPGALTPATDGALALDVLGSQVFALGTRVQGGSGGLGFVDAQQGCFPSADGGMGAHVGVSAVFESSVTLLDSTIEGGAGGVSPGPNCPAGVAGADLELVSSNLMTVPANARGFFAASPVRDDEDLFLRFSGQPGDLAVLLVGDLAQPLVAPDFDGPLHLSPVSGAFLFGLVPTSGILDVQLPLTDLGPGVESITLPLQAVYLDPASLRFVEGDPSVVTLLDETF